MEVKNNFNNGKSVAEVIIQKSTNKNKKFMANVNGKLIHFGAAGFSDYLHHTDEGRKQLYIKRHEQRENWNDPTTAGFWSRWLLWNKNTIDDSITDINKRFNLNVKMG